jgi:hypothetical protein
MDWSNPQSSCNSWQVMEFSEEYFGNEDVVKIRVNDVLGRKGIIHEVDLSTLCSNQRIPG